MWTMWRNHSPRLMRDLLFTAAPCAHLRHPVMQVQPVTNAPGECDCINHLAYADDGSFQTHSAVQPSTGLYTMHGEPPGDP